LKKIIIASVLALALITPTAALAATSKPAIKLSGKTSAAKEGTAPHEMSESGTKQSEEGATTKKKGLITKSTTKIAPKKVVKKATK
jgi:hypothetical protein